MIIIIFFKKYFRKGDYLEVVSKIIISLSIRFEVWLDCAAYQFGFTDLLILSRKLFVKVGKVKRKLQGNDHSS